MSGSATNRLVQSNLESASESTLTEGLLNANNRTDKKGKSEKKKKK